MLVKNTFVIAKNALLGALWLGSLLTIGFSNNLQFHIFSAAILASVSVIVMIRLWHQHKNLEKLQKQEALYLSVTQTLSQLHECIVFDEHGKTLFSTHPGKYQTREEFFRKFIGRIAPSPEALSFKNWVEEHHSGDCLLEGGGNGLGLQQQWWLCQTLPVSGVSHDNQLVLITEITPYIDSFQILKQQYKQLETFIDQAPFGVFYLNPTGHIIGVNQTFATWLGLTRDALLGHSLNKFVSELQLTSDSPSQGKLVSFTSPTSGSFKAIVFIPDTKRTLSPAVVCRLDNQDILLPPSLSSNKKGFIAEESFAHATIPAVIIDKAGAILAFNPSFASMISEFVTFSNGEEFTVGIPLFDLIHATVRQESQLKLERLMQSEQPTTPLEILFEGGKAFSTAYVSRLGMQNTSSEARFMIQFIDISEQKRLEQQFIQSQKMQAVGQLAGGIAHDFNNLLTAMIGFSDLLLQRYMPNDQSYMDVVQIKQNANRAANLVRQLLAFSRQQNLQPKIINITDTLAELSALLRRLLGAGVDLKVVHGRDIWPVKVDPGQLEQVIINLAVNARDAMQADGTLIIRTGHYQCHRQHRVGHDMMPPGDYVLVEVIDNGHGISAEHIDHIFEPFFSTKEVGSGTGLGLSTVYGIVKQTGGFVSVESVVDEGTTFKIFLPRYVGSEQVHTTQVEGPGIDLTGVETILLVEDEDPVRLFSARALREKGYRVIEANSGDAALDIIKNHQEKVDLLVTDVVMPRMDGPTLSKKVRDILPDIKTIFISGYTEDTFRKNLDHNARIHFLAKPFTLKDLAAKVKEVLHTP